MRILHDFFYGMLSAVNITAVARLCPRPYPRSADALRDDWAWVGGDLAWMMRYLKKELSDER